MSKSYCYDPNVQLEEFDLRDVLLPCPQLATTLPTIVALQLTILFTFGYWKKMLMRKVGIADEDIKLILSSRRPLAKANKPTVETDDGNAHKSTVHDDSIDDEMAQTTTVTSSMSDSASVETASSEFCLTKLVEKYGDKKLRTVDALPRKFCHFFLTGLSIFVIELLTSTFVMQLQTMYLSGLISVSILVFFNTCFPDTCFSSYLFGIARIRDGKVGRWNLCVAGVATSLGAFVVFIIAFEAIMPNVSDIISQTMIGSLIYTPLVVGDAMGELIGGPFGGTFFNTFRVKGFGEINRKSVEGCFAVFCGSLVGCIVMCLSYGAIKSSWMVLCLALAIVTTIVETIAFRSTDNFFIPVCNTVVFILALGPLGHLFCQ